MVIVEIVLATWFGINIFGLVAGLLIYAIKSSIAIDTSKANESSKVTETELENA